MTRVEKKDTVGEENWVAEWLYLRVHVRENVEFFPALSDDKVVLGHVGLLAQDGHSRVGDDDVVRNASVGGEDQHGRDLKMSLLG